MSSRMCRSIGNGCLVAVRSVGSLFRFIRSRHSFCKMEEQNRFPSAQVLRTLLIVYISAFCRPYDIRSFCIGFAVSVMSLICRGNSSSCACETARSRVFIIFSVSALILEKTKIPRSRALNSVESSYTGGISLLCRRTGGASVACCMLAGRVVILRTLLWVFFRSSSYG